MESGEGAIVGGSGDKNLNPHKHIPINPGLHSHHFSPQLSQRHFCLGHQPDQPLPTYIAPPAHGILAKATPGHRHRSGAAAAVAGLAGPWEGDECEVRVEPAATDSAG